jgi:3-hydroxyisobutyrate dehydrogenase-like beta-hydroxyacid dehydrogenase
MEHVGFVGLGTMGASMAANVLKAGSPLTVWNRTPGRAPVLVDGGAQEAVSPSALAAVSDVVIVCVSDTPDVEAVLFGPDGVADGARRGSLVIDCSTISPDATRDFGRRLAKHGVSLVDAPVSGGSEGARLGTLTMFVGGAEPDVARARPILEAMGKTITHLGPLGSGQAAKAVNQVVISGVYLGVAEGIVLGLKAGLDPHRLVEALSGGSKRPHDRRRVSAGISTVTSQEGPGDCPRIGRTDWDYASHDHAGSGDGGSARCSGPHGRGHVGPGPSDPRVVRNGLAADGPFRWPRACMIPP